MSPLPKTSKVIPRTAMEARALARASQTGVLSWSARDVLSDIQNFPSDDARAAFADKWISLIASRLEETWPALYALLRLVKERELYRHEGYLEIPEVFPDFPSYFEARTGKPMTLWVELEATHRYVIDSRPELITQLYSVVRAEWEAQVTGSPTPQGGKPPDARDSIGILRPETTESVVLTQKDRAKKNHIGIDAQRKLDYLAQDEHAALLADVRAGRLSIDRAYRQAKGLPPLTPLDLLRRAWGKASPDERQTFLAEVQGAD